MPDLKEALNLAKKEQDARLQARVLITTGKIFQANRLLRQADSVFSMARQILYHLPKNKDYLYLLKSLAICNYYLNNNQKVLQYTREGLKVATSLNDKLLQGTFNNISGIAESSLGNNAQALEYYLKALELFTGLHDENKIATADVNIGTIYQSQGDDNNAQKYFLQALPVAKKIKDTTILSAIYANLGNVASDRGRYKRALVYFQKSLALSIKINDHYSVASDMDNIGEIYKNLGDTEKEFHYYRQALEMAKKNQDIVTMTQTMEDIAEYYEAQKNLTAAIESGEKSLVYAKKSGNVSIILAAMKLLQRTYAKKGDYRKAYEFLKSYNKLNDSVFSQEKSRRLVEVEEAWKSKAKSRALELAQETQKRVEAYFIIFILSTLLVVTFLLFWLRQRGVKGKELQRQKMFLDFLLEESESHVIIADNDGYNTYLSPSYLKAFKRGFDERIGASVLDHIHPDDIALLNKLVGDIKKGKKEHDELLFRLQNSDGEYRTMRGVVKKIKNEGLLMKGFIVNFWDVTEIQKSQQALRESEEKFRNIFNAFPDIYFKINKEDVITDVSPSIKRITGFDPDEVVGKPISTFTKLNIDWEQTRQRLIDRSKVEDLNLSLLSKDKVEIACSLTAQVIKNAQGSVVGFEGTLRDITKRISADKELKNSQKKLKVANDSKDKLLSIIAHDLRGAIGTQKAFMSLIAEDISDFSEEELSNLLTAIKNSVDSTFTLVENLLSWARIMRENIVPRLSDHNISDVIRGSMDVMKEQANSKNISLVYEGKKHVVEAIDPDLMNIAFRNLISNAIKFSNPGSEIKISVVTESKGVEVIVEDHGVGMNKEDIDEILSNTERLVSRLGTNKEKGTGLGLVIVREFIAMNNGKLLIESQQGVGTRFIIQFPGS